MNKNILILVVISLVLVSGVYMYSKQIYDEATDYVEAPEETSQVESGAISNDDSISTISAELENTETADLGAELMQVDAELEAAVQEGL